MSQGRDIICLPQQRNLIRILDNAGVANNSLQNAEVCLRKALEVDALGDLLLNSESHSFSTLCRSDRGQSLVDVSRVLDVVDIVALLGLLGRQGQARPDDRVGVDGGDEEGQLVLLDIVDDRGIGLETSSQVEEGATLARGGASISIPNSGSAKP